MNAVDRIALPDTAGEDALGQLLAALRARHAEFAANQCISDDVIDLMKAAGVYRALVARRFGGDEASPMAFLRLIETIAMADGSAGWVASFGFSAIYLSALPIETLEEIYAHGPDVVFAGGIYPPQPAANVPGGFSVSGRWAWGSGCTGADLIGVGIKPDNADVTAAASLPRIAVMPRARVKLVPNWDVNGLKGTGSHDMVVENVVVPQRWTFTRGGASSLTTPLYRYPSMALAAQVLAVVALGVARAALDDLTALAGERDSITGAPVLAERAYVQSERAKAEAALRAARAFFFESTQQAYEHILAGDMLNAQGRNLLRLSATHAAHTGADVAQTAYKLSGTTGIFRDHPIARRFQDALVVPQHAFLAEGTWQQAGRVLLNMQTAAGFP